jgi:hypothetical protein
MIDELATAHQFQHPAFCGNAGAYLFQRILTQPSASVIVTGRVRSRAAAQ